jgi:hypothetical protein
VVLFFGLELEVKSWRAMKNTEFVFKNAGTSFWIQLGVLETSQQKNLESTGLVKKDDPEMKFLRKSDTWPMLLILLALIFGVLQLGHLPDQVPSHWNWKGEVDGYSSNIKSLKTRC